MDTALTVTDIIMNALDKDYSVEHAATDLGDLMNELELIRHGNGTDSPRLTELENLIPLQGKLALGKFQGDQIYAQLDRLNIRVVMHD